MAFSAPADHCPPAERSCVPMCFALSASIAKQRSCPLGEVPDIDNSADTNAPGSGIYSRIATHALFWQGLIGMPI